MINGCSVLGVVPAREGSKRLPGKNLRPMFGRPMIDWTLEAARGATTLDHLVVTSDDDAVLAFAAVAGVEAVRRPPELAGDATPVYEAVAHLLATIGGEWDMVVLLQPTSPLRLSKDIDESVSMCAEPGTHAVVTACATLEPLSHYRRISADGRLTSMSDAGPETVRLNGAVYVIRREMLNASRTFCPEGAKARLMPPDRSWDVDSLEEFAACEALLAKRGGRHL